MRDSSSTGESSVADSKRRKLDDEQSSGPESPKKSSAVPFPNSSPTTPRANGANGSSSRTPAPLSTSRLRTPAKPTVPAIPSPLRQAWSDASSASSREESRASPPQAAKQTQTASFMAELIKETTPPKRPDLSNPYQTASPIGKVGPPKRSTRRPRATGKPSAPAKEQGTEEKVATTSDKDKVKEYSPQAIIEATVPKGSKRSRPPAHLEKRTPSEETPPAPVKDQGPTVVETRKAAYVVEEPEEDEDEARRATKKAKSSINGHGLPSSVKSASPTPTPDVDIVVEEVDVDMNSAADREKSKESAKPTVQVNGSTSQSPLSATSPTSRPFTGMKSNSIPKEPSKLRFSFQADTPTAPPMPSTTSPISDVAPATPQPAPPLPKTDFKFSPPSSGFNFTFKADSAPTEKAAEKVPENDTEAIKEKVRAAPVPSLPVFTFGVDGTSVLPSSSEHSKVQNDVKALPKSSLPTFNFGSSKSTPFAFDYDRSMAKAPGSYDGSYKPSPPKTHKPAIIRPISSPSPAPSTSTPPPVKGFDFAAAGMKAPVAAKDSKTCSSCGLSSPTSAQKCTVCDEPFPGSASAASPPISTPAPPAPPTGGFNWAAAGMKPPSAPQGKTCSSCGLSSPTSAQKCTVCDEPFPGSASGASPPVSAPTPPAPPTGGFNWAAAGIKPPSAPQGTWKCSDCGLNSPEAKVECTVCGAPKP
ncbi:hypothetical protein CVT26_009904 [Gymnopilus dilepis]|uniref:RanBP2-type domain-containing protein n=1 Tax=Gymnopilus dilepis TaxID=231916 RepID=A0A409YBY7_9AGAR|nr:hypothetical protein CVT26_009904 [Gymnopilus dilepis]